MMRVKKNDTVVVLSGKDQGKQGTVIEVLPKIGKVMVKGVCIITRHVKPRKQGDVGGIRKKEGYVPLSIVMPLCTSCKKPCRVNTKRLENQPKVRVCNKCEETF